MSELIDLLTEAGIRLLVLLALIGALLLLVAIPFVLCFGVVPFERERAAVCYSRCEGQFLPDHRPAGWTMLDSTPCTCGVVLDEVTDAP